jgi:poly(3-hydroxybutyrate) depolymerase
VVDGAPVDSRNRASEARLDPMMATPALRRRFSGLRLVCLAAGVLVVLSTMPTRAGGADAPAARSPAAVRSLQATTSTGRQGAYFVPASVGSEALPLLVFLHGSGGKGANALLRLRPLAERERFVVVAPDSVSVAGVWLVDSRSQGATEDHRHVMSCLREVLAQRNVRVDSRQVLVAGFSVGGAAAGIIASREEAFTAFAVLHGHVPTESLGTRRVRGWLSAGDRDRQRPPAVVQALAGELTSRLAFPEIETRVFAADHALGDEELSALAAWWLRRERR